MGMLDRYKKPGGFLQLLALIEGLGKQKQDQFMGLIAQESPIWEEAIRKRLLTWDKILSWQTDFVREIFSRSQPLTVATALRSCSPQTLEIAMNAVMEKRKIQTLITESKATPGEIATCIHKIIAETRAMLNEGFFKVERIDPELVIPEDIEDELATALSGHKVEVPEAVSHETPSDAPSGELRFETPRKGEDNSEFLKKKVNQLTSENSALKHELIVLRGKLDQIRKIA